MKEFTDLSIAGFIKTSRAIAVLDAIISPEWEYRYYSFNSNWADKECLASMRDGQGRYWFALQTESGIAITGNAKNTIKGSILLNKLPKLFMNNFWNEPAFNTQESSFVGWKLNIDNGWEFNYATDDVISINAMINILLGNPEDYRIHAMTYFEKELNIEIIEKIYMGTKIDEKILRELNNEITVDDIRLDLEEIGYTEFG
jgi:hypothetical protein